MKSIKNYVATTINRRMGSKGALWQQSFYDRVIRNEAQLRSTIEYIHQNPATAGLVAEAKSYEFSSARPELETDLEAFLGG